MVFASAAFSIPRLLTPTQSPTVFDLPSGVLAPANDYLIGIHLIDNGSFISPLDDRSTAWVEFQTVPALSPLLPLAVGLVGTRADQPVPDLPSEPAWLSGCRLGGWGTTTSALPREEVLDLISPAGWHGSCSPLRCARLMATSGNVEYVMNLDRHSEGRPRWCRKRGVRWRARSSGSQAPGLRRLSQAARHAVALGDQPSPLTLAGMVGRGRRR